MAQPARPIVLTARQREILESLSRSRTVERRLAERVDFILWSAEGAACVDQAARRDVDAQRVRRWRKRWHEAQEMLWSADEQGCTDEELAALMLDVLADGYRSGTPPKFSPEELAQLIALACQDPKSLGLPVTHWTPRELAQQAVAQGIVKSISPRHVARFFGGGRHPSSPHPSLAQPQDRRP
jgi:putative transposase